MRRAEVSIGERFGRLIVEALVIVDGLTFVECLCDCGRKRLVKGRSRLTRATTPSCGCARSISKVKHGRSESRLYRIWAAMRARCRNKRNSAYRYYGARGIRVCERWDLSFEAFLADMGEPPTDRHSIDRINNDGNYEPGNCRWVTQNIQTQNSRHAKLTVEDVDSIRLRVAAGATTTDLSREYGVSQCTIAAATRGVHFTNATAAPVDFERGFALGEKHGQSKLNPDKVRKIRRAAKAGASQGALAREYGVHRITIRQVLRGETWIHVKEAA